MKAAVVMNISLVVLMVVLVLNGNISYTTVNIRDVTDDAYTIASPEHETTNHNFAASDDAKTTTQSIRRPDKEGSKIDWNDVFSFVPYSIIYCNNLTAHLPPKVKLPPALQQKLADYEQVVKEVMERTGRRYGGSENFFEMQYVYEILAAKPFVRTICETGFNAGHSAFAWLSGGNHTKVYSFDIAAHEYAEEMAKYLSERYPGRLQVTWGNSIETLPVFRKKHPEVRCDVMLIDGGHRYEPCKADYDNFRLMANRDNVVIIDDYPRKEGDWMQMMGDVWEPAKRRGEISEIFHCVHKNRNHGFAMAHYNV